MPVTATATAAGLVLLAAREFWGVILVAAVLTTGISCWVGLRHRARPTGPARAAGLGVIIALISTAALMPVVELGNLLLDVTGLNPDGAPLAVGETLGRAMIEAGVAVLLAGPVTAAVGAGAALTAWKIAARRLAYRSMVADPATPS